MSTTLSWLHISDIHFRATDSWRDSTARDALLDCLQKNIGSAELTKPNLILCTGDIGFGDTSSQKLPAQYEDAKLFFERIEKICEIERKHMFAVPGNHDISRSEANKFADRYYRQIAKESFRNNQMVNDSIANKSKEYLDSLNRLEAFRTFFIEAFPHVNLDDHMHYVHQLSINGIDIQIVGLNSVWTCSGSEEDRDVWVGAQAQISKIKKIYRYV